MPWFLIPSCNMPQITVCFDADCALNCRRLRSNSMQNATWFDANRSTFSCDFNSCFALNSITTWLSTHCKTLKNGTYFEKECPAFQMRSSDKGNCKHSWQELTYLSYVRKTRWKQNVSTMLSAWESRAEPYAMNNRKQQKLLLNKPASQGIPNRFYINS